LYLPVADNPESRPMYVLSFIAPVCSKNLMRILIQVIKENINPLLLMKKTFAEKEIFEK